MKAVPCQGTWEERSHWNSFFFEAQSVGIHTEGPGFESSSVSLASGSSTARRRAAKSESSKVFEAQWVRSLSSTHVARVQLHLLQNHPPATEWRFWARINEKGWITEGVQDVKTANSIMRISCSGDLWGRKQAKVIPLWRAGKRCSF